MRATLALSLGVGLAAGASVAAADPVQSDPAFLGIGFTGGLNVCTIDSVTEGGPAAAAGFRIGDGLVKIAGRAIHFDPTCSDVQASITAQSPGDTIPIQVERDGHLVTMNVTLASRSDLLLRRIGSRMPRITALDVDGQHRYELAEHHTTLVVGALKRDCASCVVLVDQIAERLARRAPGASVLALTSAPDDALGSAGGLSALRSLRGTTPLAVTDDATFGNLAFADATERVYFLVIDYRGVVKIVAPIAPDADDIDAAAADVLAAAEQAEHARTRR